MSIATEEFIIQFSRDLLVALNVCGKVELETVKQQLRPDSTKWTALSNPALKQHPPVRIHAKLDFDYLMR
jgi:hypothetical protein